MPSLPLLATALLTTAIAAADPSGCLVLRDGIAASRAHFLREHSGRVAFLGGSITEMPGWKELVQQDLARRFPDVRFDFVSAGIASLDSTPDAFRLRRDVLAHGPIDLLFVESAVNDAVNGRSGSEQIRGIEGIVRQARIANPATDVVLLYFADPDKIADYRAGRRPAVIGNHEQVAERYRIPSLDLAHEVEMRIAAGEFTWEKDFKDLHPAPFGHALYASAIGRLFAAGWSGASATPAIPALPPPLDPASYWDGRLIAPDQAGRLSGWRLDADWHPADGRATRNGFVGIPVLVAEQAGASLSLDFTGRGIGIFAIAGPDTGVVEFSIDGGPPSTRDLFSPWSGGLHLPWAQMLDADLRPGRHVLTLRIAAGANPASTGHAVRIAHFLAN